MEVILPNLSRQSPGEVLAALQGGDLDTGSEDILKCVEYSYSNLSQEAQRLLLCLAPFSGFIFRREIPNYAEELRKLEPFQDYDFSLFDGAIQEAIHWGLLEAMDKEQQLLTIQPVFPYFLKTKLNELDEETQLALQEVFKNLYQGLVVLYNQLVMSKVAHEKQLGINFFEVEYENLYTALKICLANQEKINIFIGLFNYFNAINDNCSAFELSNFVCKSLESYPPEICIGEIGSQVLTALDRLAYCYWKNKNFQKSKEIYQKKVQQTRKLKEGLEERRIQLDLAGTYHQLGMVAQDLREYEEARKNYQQALAICVEFGDCYEQAGTHHELGIVAQELREYEEARKNYQQALAIYVEFGDRYSSANTYHQLGRVAEELREYEEARKNYQQALAIKVVFGDRYSSASTYHQLGRVAEELREYEEARKNYQQALAIYVVFGDRYEQASTYQGLGAIAQELREYEEARNNYQQAIALFVEFGDRYEQAGTYHNLGAIAQELREYEEARNNYQQAIAIFVEFGDRYSSASTYYQLGSVALALREYEEARKNYQQALAIKVEFGDRYSQASTYHGLGVVAEELEEFQEAKTNFLQALSIYAEFNDQYSLETFSIPALIRLYQATQDSSILETLAQFFGTTVEEVLGALETG